MKLNCRYLSRVCCLVPFVDSFINATMTLFFSKKGKDKLYDKSTHGASCTMAVVCLSGESESRRRCHRRVRMLYVQRL